MQAPCLTTGSLTGGGPPRPSCGEAQGWSEWGRGFSHRHMRGCLHAQKQSRQLRRKPRPSFMQQEMTEVEPFKGLPSPRRHVKPAALRFVTVATLADTSHLNLEAEKKPQRRRCGAAVETSDALFTASHSSPVQRHFVINAAKTTAFALCATLSSMRSAHNTVNARLRLLPDDASVALM